MAGHSHAKNIMHRKSAQNAKRARAFGKLIREISVSARQGMADPDHNPRLRAAVKAALVANMPRDTVDRAIKRAATPAPARTGRRCATRATARAASRSSSRR